MFYLWRRVNSDERSRLWWLYGWFCGLMLCGSCIGTVTWAAWMQVIVNLLSGNDPTPVADGGPPRFKRLLFWASASRWRAVFVVTYAFEFLCLSVAKLMVLDRLLVFSGNKSRRWVMCGRIIIASVVAANLVGLAGNIAAAVNYERAASFEFAASNEYAVDNGGVGKHLEADGDNVVQLAHYIKSVQAASEVAVLLAIDAAFVVVGVACFRRMRHAVSGHTNNPAIQRIHSRLQLQIVGTTVVVFVAFLLRSVYATMSAVANKLQDTSTACPNNTAGSCSAACYNTYTHMVGWMNRTPQFQLVIMLTSSPLTLMFALWGMTSQRMLISLRQDGEAVPMRQGL